MELFEKKLEGEIVFDGKVMTIHRDKIELPTGQTSFREVVEHSGGVVILATIKKDNQDKIIMVKQFVRHKTALIITDRKYTWKIFSKYLIVNSLQNFIPQSFL